MADLPYMNVSVTEYIADTTHLSTLEQGAYWKLILHYWNHQKSLPSDEEKLARIAGLPLKEWMKVRDVIEEFFILADGAWIHGRVEEEMEKANQKITNAAKAGKASAASRRRAARLTGVQRAINGRSTDVQRSAQREANQKKKENINPLTPLQRGASDAPGPLGGRASTASEAKQIGSVLRDLKPGRTNDDQA